MATENFDPVRWAHYLVFSRMTGVTGDCKGVYTLHIEERP